MRWLEGDFDCSVECFVLFQIEDGDIYASINLRDGMVSFHHNPEKYNNPKMLKKLDSEVWLQSVCGDSCLYYRTLCCIKKVLIISLIPQVNFFTTYLWVWRRRQ